MNHLPRVVATAAAAVLAFDTLGALASTMLGFPYRSLALGSFLIYATAGFFAARFGGLWTGAIAGGTVALVEGTVGWAIAWALGPGRPPGQTGILTILGTVMFVVATGIVLGLVGGLIARLVGRSPNVAA